LFAVGQLISKIIVRILHFEENRFSQRKAPCASS